jgi:hypothetical protein
LSLWHGRQEREGDARMDSKVAQVSFVDFIARKVLGGTAGLQSLVRAFEIKEFDLRCKSERRAKEAEAGGLTLLESLALLKF